jgi:Holliday junction resolvase
MSNYRKGANFERTVCGCLSVKGALCIRAAGSHGVADVIAIWPDGPAWLVQVKTNGEMSPAERKALGQVAHKYRMVPIKASRPERGVIRFERYHRFGQAGYQWSEVTL